MPGLPAELRQATFDPSTWHTNFARHSVLLTSILPGAPPSDGIPPIDHAPYGSIAAARFLAPSEPVIAVAVRGRARAYPLQILVWHEIVNDTLSGVPIAVAYCPLCNSAIVFDRRHGNALPRDTGFQRPYGQNPYAGYDSPESSRPFHYGGRPDPRLPPVERAESIAVGAGTVVVLFDALRGHPVTAVTVGVEPAVVLFDAHVLSALDQMDIAGFWFAVAALLPHARLLTVGPAQ